MFWEYDYSVTFVKPNTVQKKKSIDIIIIK